MSRRNDKGQFSKPPSKRSLSFLWFLVLLSLVVLWTVAKWLASDFSSFRSCGANSNGLTVVNCGKSGLNFGDLIFISLFILAVGFTVSLATQAWRVTRRMLP